MLNRTVGKQSAKCRLQYTEVQMTSMLQKRNEGATCRWKDTQNTPCSIVQGQASMGEHLTYTSFLFFFFGCLALIRVNREGDLNESLFPRKGEPCGCPTPTPSTCPGGHLAVVPTHLDGSLWSVPEFKHTGFKEDSHSVHNFVSCLLHTE